MIIIGTVVFQSLTARPMAKVLKVAMPKTYGVLIVGANPLSIMVAEALNRANVDSIICDTDWEHLRAARISGLNTYYGNPSSEHAAMHLNFSPFGYMLGLSNHFEYNVTQATSFRDDFGARNVFILPPNQSSERQHKHIASTHNSGRILFSEEASYRALKKRISDGAVIKITELSEEYNYKKWLADNESAQILLAVKENGDIAFETADSPVFAEKGIKIFYLTTAKNTSTEQTDAN